MAVKISNMGKLETMIREAEGRASARLLTVEDIVDALEAVEQRLLLVSTKTDALGTSVEVDVNHQDFPRAYKYTPESTHFCAKLQSNGWKVYMIQRDTCWSRTRFAHIEYTAQTKAHMIDRLSIMD